MSFELSRTITPGFEALVFKASRGIEDIYELTYIRKDGSRFPAIVSVTALRDDQGAIIGYLLIGTDNTARKQAEDQRQVDQRLRDHLQAANKELEAFSYSVSHDLRAPLRGIDGFSQALLEDYADQLDDVGKGYLQEVRSASQEMGQLIDDVLRLSRVTRSEMHHDAVNLSELAEQIMIGLQRQEPERRVRVRIERELFTRGDKRLLQILLTNLLGNAWKFTSKREDAEIAFGKEQKDGRDVYFVRDNGAGFNMAYGDKLFRAFQRLHTVGEFEGTGIGLATVQRIVLRHGGTISAVGAVNQGATIFFTLTESKEQP